MTDTSRDTQMLIIMATLFHLPIARSECSFIKQLWNNASNNETRILARLIFSSSEYCRHRKCYSFKNCVALLPWLTFLTVILTSRSLQTYVMSRVVTEQIVTQSRHLVEFSVSKWLKLTQFTLGSRGCFFLIDSDGSRRSQLGSLIKP